MVGTPLRGVCGRMGHERPGQPSLPQGDHAMKRQHGMATVWQAGMMTALGLAGMGRGPGWPCFTGPAHDNTHPGAIGLAAEWPTNGPAVVWEAKITGGGNGSFSSPVILAF